MRRTFFILLTFGLLITCLAPAGWAQTMHPLFPLLDETGGHVLKSGNAISAVRTCGQCHDAGYIIANSTRGHASQTELYGPPFSRLKHSAQTVAAGQASADAMNCFLCHFQQPNNRARLEALSDGRSDWAVTATLEGSGIVVKSGAAWQYQRSAFNAAGELLPAYAQMQDPKNEQCGYCHGQVHTQNKIPLVFESGAPELWSTFTTGQVFSPQRIRESGLNLAGKQELNRPWDVHSERLLDCVSCHFALNNPAHQQADPANQPDHLAYSPRRLDIREYLHRPSHILAGSTAADAPDLPGAAAPMRRCEGCHDYNKTHDWLPFKARHANSLTCETCHIPRLYVPAASVVDLSGDEAVIRYRGGDGSADAVHHLAGGFQPVILPRAERDGRVRLAPFNLITTWERDDKEADGASRLRGEVQPYGIHHTIAHGEYVVRDCQTCHDRNSMLSAALPLGTERPGAMPLLWQAQTGVLPAGQITARAGELYFNPSPEMAGFYLLGHTRVAWVHILGSAVLLLTLAGIVLHAYLRIRANKRKRAGEGPTQLVYMYEVYERYWHWLQAIVIVGLIFTGLTIHAPGRFAWLSFAAAVRIHNVLAGLLLFNAFLSLFYHFASGKIKTYLPESSGFFSQMYSQGRYYLGGIFKGEPHPFEKSLQKKLNPLQKITYLVILNLLLPLQIVSGILIAGAQIWPDLSASLGGLGFLVPAHSLLAWFFAAFLILHIYLTTTGHTPLANIKAMISGWEKVAVHQEEK